MVDRIEIAKKFIEEQLQKRDDIISAFVVGSLTSGCRSSLTRGDTI